MEALERHVLYQMQLLSVEMAYCGNEAPIIAELIFTKLGANLMAGRLLPELGTSCHATMDWQTNAVQAKDHF